MESEREGLGFFLSLGARRAAAPPPPPHLSRPPLPSFPLASALEEAAMLGHTGPLRPAHVAAAFQRLEAEGRGLPCTAHPRPRVRL